MKISLGLYEFVGSELSSFCYTVFCRGLSSIGGSGLGPGGVSSGYVGSYTSPQSVYTSGQSSYASGSVARQSGYPDLYGTRTQVGFVHMLVVHVGLFLVLAMDSHCKWYGTRTPSHRIQVVGQKE